MDRRKWLTGPSESACRQMSGLQYTNRVTIVNLFFRRCYVLIVSSLLQVRKGFSTGDFDIPESICRYLK